MRRSFGQDERSALNRWFGRPTRAVAIVVVGIGYASAAFAIDLRLYYPLEVGVTRTYQVERQSNTQIGVRVAGALGEGWLQEEVVGLSKLSGRGALVYKVRGRIEVTGGGPFAFAEGDVVSHLSVRRNLILIHGVNDDFYESPDVVLSDPPVPLSEVPSALVDADGSLRTLVGDVSHTTEAVTVPAGKFRKAIKQVFEGLLSGEVGGRKIREGTIRETIWYAKRVGPVQRITHRDFRLRSPEGLEVVYSDTTSVKLTSYSTP